MRLRKTGGFSVLEILVALAIIGLLISMVMPFARKAKIKAADENIRVNLNNIKPQAQIYYDKNSTFGTPGTSCTQSDNVFTEPTVARQINGATTTANRPGVCANDELAWVVSVPLQSGGSWCVDSSGISTSAVADTEAIRCP